MSLSCVPINILFVCLFCLPRPKRLLLHLKRFFAVKPRGQPSLAGDENADPNALSSVASLATFDMAKNKVPVDILPSLSLSPFLVSPPDSSSTKDTLDESSSETNDAKGNEYELESIVHHIGNTLSSGHYIADALRPRLDTVDGTSPPPESTNLSRTNENEPVKQTPDTTKENDYEKELEWNIFDDGNSCRTSIDRIRGNERKKESVYMLLYKLN